MRGAGVGINVTNSAPTTCLADLARAATPGGAGGVTREAVLASILNETESILAIFAACGFAPLYAEYTRRWLHSGQRVRVRTRDGGAGHVCVIRGASDVARRGERPPLALFTVELAQV